MKKFSFLLFGLIFSLCSCEIDSNNDNSSSETEQLSGEWRSFVATKDNVKNTNNIAINPFNTVMQMNYFLSKDNIENNEQIFTDATTLFDNEVGRLHKMFDRHNSYYTDNGVDLITNIKTINDSFGSNIPIKCDDELYDLLKFAVECYSLTDGQFNMFTGSLTNFWESAFNEVYNYTPYTQIDPDFNVKEKEYLQSLVDSVPSSIEEINEQLTFDDENKTVTFNKCDFNNNKKIIISVGGIAKGYATDIIKKKLLENNFKDAYLISGGSSLSSVSKPIYTDSQGGQKISVINPEKTTFTEKKSAFSIKVTEEFNFSTSGNYTEGKSYRFIDENGNIIYRHHIINPFTGYPESHYRSVSVHTTYFSNAYVDAFSTAFMNLSIEDGLTLRNKILSLYPDADLDMVYIIQKGYDNLKEGIEAEVSVYSTSNFNNTLTLNEGVNYYEK